MKPPHAHRDEILARIAHGLRANREPGWHFAGHYLRMSFERMDPADTVVEMEVGPHCHDARGELDLVSFGVFVDIALVAAARAVRPDTLRFATVWLQIRFTGAPRSGDLVAHSRFDACFGGERTQTVHTSTRIFAGGQHVCDASAAFMQVPPKPGLRVRKLGPEPRSRFAHLGHPGDLHPEELRLYASARAQLDAGLPLMPAFWGVRARRAGSGACSRMAVGTHQSNRSGDVQGGVTLGNAMLVASAGMPPGQSLSSMAVSYLSPGQAPAMRARAEVVRAGRSTSTLRVHLRNRDGKPIMEGLATGAVPGVSA